MQYKSTYLSPLGEMTLSSDEIGLTGIWFVGQKYYARILGDESQECETEPIKLAKLWLDAYFDGKEPEIKVPLHLIGTDFQKEVWEILQTIPYGKTMSYGEIALKITKRRGNTNLTKKMSAQAVGSAVGHNPISIIIPCHRVLGSDGSLTGYAGGLDRKKALLNLEKCRFATTQ